MGDTELLDLLDTWPTKQKPNLVSTPEHRLNHKHTNNPFSMEEEERQQKQQQQQMKQLITTNHQHQHQHQHHSEVVEYEQRVSCFSHTNTFLECNIEYMSSLCCAVCVEDCTSHAPLNSYTQ